MAWCRDVVIKDDGTLEWFEVIADDPGIEAPPFVQRQELRPFAGMVAERPADHSVSYGDAGAGIVAAVIEAPGQAPARAAFADGHWVVTSPGRWPEEAVLVGLDASGQNVSQVPLDTDWD
jgi:hypothetical protein